MNSYIIDLKEVQKGKNSADLARGQPPSKKKKKETSRFLIDITTSVRQMDEKEKSPGVPSSPDMPPDLGNKGQIVYPNEVKLSPGWRWAEGTSTPHSICLRIVGVLESPEIIKRIQIENGNEICFFVKKQQIFPVNISKSFSTIQELQDIFWKFESVKLCKGVSKQHLLAVDKSKNGLKKDSHWQSKICLRVCERQYCRQCARLIDALRKKLGRMEKQSMNKRRRIFKLQETSRKLERRDRALEVCSFLIKW